MTANAALERTDGAQLTSERWAPVPRFEGYYEVSDAGRVRRIAHGQRARREAILTPHTDARGKVTIMLSASGRQERFALHRLVALAFLGPPPAGRPYVVHRDGDRSNAGAGNLQHMSTAELVAHTVALKRQRAAAEGVAGG